MTDVLTAGAGPVGLAMAIELKRYGLSVRIVDKAAQRTDKSKALAIWSRTLELMDRAGCSAAFLAAGYKVSGANVSTGSKQIAHFSLSGTATPYPFALMLPQSDTERLLEEHLNSRGVQVERSVELTKFSESEQSVVSTLRDADGREETVDTPWLIGCDGAHSTVRHELGMEFVGDTLTSDWMLADVHLAGVHNPHEIGVFWHADGVLVIFPISETRFRVIADSGTAYGDGHRPEPTSSDPTLEDVQAILDRRGPGGIIASAPIWLAGFHINERKVAHYQAGRVFLAGDAAHIHSPAGGQGMNTGIQDACNLAWKLALVQRGICAADPLLASYSIERSFVGEQVLKGAGRTTTVAIMKGEIKQSIRNHIASLLFGLSPVQKMVANAIEEVSIGYPNSPLTSPSEHIRGGPAAGERAPMAESQPPVGAGDTPRFALFAESGDERALQILARYANLLEPDMRRPFVAGGLWLVRPDGYIALATKHDGWEDVGTYFDKIMAPSSKNSQTGSNAGSAS